MKKFIYESDFKAGPEASKKQIILFDADARFAESEGYKHIQTSDGVIFMFTELGLLEIEATEEQIIESAALEAALELDKAPEQVELSPGDEGYCKHCHNILMIDDIINNTLSQKESIQLSQADTMLKLVSLQNLLMEQSNA